MNCMNAQEVLKTSQGGERLPHTPRSGPKIGWMEPVTDNLWLDGTCGCKLNRRLEAGGMLVHYC